MRALHSIKMLGKNMPPQEKKPPAGINHYADKYWNDLPEIRAYLCKNATGDENLWWIPYIKKRYAQTPFRNCLILACGNGRIEREMFDTGIAIEFDAFDYSDIYLDQAQSQKGGRPITYFKSSFETLVLPKKYDLVVNVAALHHVGALDSLLQKAAEAMPPNGLFVNWDYVGPNRNQYTNEHVKLMEKVNASLPEKFQTRHPIRHAVEDCIIGDITEAVHSSEIIATFEKYFEIIEQHNLGGGIAYQLLWNNIEEFSKDTLEAKQSLQQLIDLDDAHTRNRTVPNLFSFFIGTPRHGTAALKVGIDAFYHERLAEQLEQQLNTNKILTQRLQEAEQRAQHQMALVQGQPSLLQLLKKIFTWP